MKLTIEQRAELYEKLNGEIIVTGLGSVLYIMGVEFDKNSSNIYNHVSDMKLYIYNAINLITKNKIKYDTIKKVFNCVIETHKSCVTRNQNLAIIRDYLLELTDKERYKVENETCSKLN
jgi:hypothetical protein